MQRQEPARGEADADQNLARPGRVERGISAAAANRASPRIPAVILGLQGGGSFGAFTWGVLDALLAAETPIEAVSGASAGALNAVFLADGLRRGGAPAARDKLERLWRRISNAAPFSGSGLGPATAAAFEAWLPEHHPFPVDSLNLDPLRELLQEEVDLEALRTGPCIDLFISATRVSDGAARVFRTREVTADVVLASACLPRLRRPVAIDGDWYWDGGYSSNPPLHDLVAESTAEDLLVVDLTPPGPGAVPRRAREIEGGCGTSPSRWRLSVRSMRSRLSVQSATRRAHSGRHFAEGCETSGFIGSLPPQPSPRFPWRTLWMLTGDCSPA
jgi:NTE family protein